MMAHFTGATLRACAIAVIFFAAAAHAREHVLIIGGAGNTGAALAKMLVARGDKVTAFVRPSTDRSRLDGIEVDYVVGDAMIAAQVEAALEGGSYTVILDTVQILDVTDQQSYTRMYANFVPLAKRLGVKQFILLGSACNDTFAEDCLLSPPLFEVAKDQTIAEYILRGSGVPYTVFRIGALMPGGPDAPDADLRTGTSFLTEDLTVFGAIWRGDFNDQILGCIGAEPCISKIFAMDDPAMAPQRENWLCKRRLETDTIIFFDPSCGPVPPLVIPTPEVQQ